MRISDWSSDVCSSDLATRAQAEPAAADQAGRAIEQEARVGQRNRQLVAPADNGVRQGRDGFRAFCAIDRIGRSTRASGRSGPAAIDSPLPRRPRHCRTAFPEPYRGPHRLRDRKSTTSELQSLMRTSYAVFCLKKKKHYNNHSKT